MRILIIEDDLQLLDIIKTSLKHRYTVDGAIDGLQGFQLLSTHQYDLVLLDRSITGMDGLEFCRRIRQQGQQVLVMLMSIQSDTGERVAGLDAGADDYLVKPFALSELEARVRALLRRRMVTELPILTWGQLSIEPSRCHVTYDGKPITLTSKEYGILELMIRNQDRIYSQRALLDNLWPAESAARGEETVRTHMKRLRQKLKPVGAGDIIETIYGLGYRLNPALNMPAIETTDTMVDARFAAVELPAGGNLGLSNPSRPVEAVGIPQETLVTRFWEKQADQVLQRIQVLDHSVQALQRNPSDESLRSQIREAGQNILGVMGSVCLPTHLPALQALGAWLPTTPLNTPTEIQILHKQLGLLVNMLEGLIQGQSTEQRTIDEALKLGSTRDSGERLAELRILVVDTDREWVTQLMSAGYRWGIQVVRVGEVEGIRQSIERACPDGIILHELMLHHNRSQMLPLLEFIQQHCPLIPLWIITQDEIPEGMLADIARDRQLLSRYQGRGFYPRSLPLDHLIEHMHLQMLQGTTRSPLPDAKILIVDDDQLMLSLLKGVLEPWGLNITTCSDPTQVMGLIDQDAPDLIVLDFEMPELNGIDLCEQLRQAELTATLPILFLTAYRDSDTIQNIFSAGADDYVSKPVITPEILTRIFNRLERSKRSRQQLEQDALTQCLTMLGTEERFHELSQQAINLRQPLSMAILGVDNLLPLTRTLGIEWGEQCLVKIAEILRAELPIEHRLERWNGSEFVVLLPGLIAASGQLILEQAVHQITQSMGELPESLQLRIGSADWQVEDTSIKAFYQRVGRMMV